MKPIIWKKSQVALGTGVVYQRTVFEHKRLFSIWIYEWEDVQDQMRYHTHAFNSIAFLLKGRYSQRRLTKDGTTVLDAITSRKPRFLPRNYCHKIVGAEKGTKSIVFAGPWSPYWAEFFEDTDYWVVYSWGRKKEAKTKNKHYVDALLDSKLYRRYK